MIFWNFWNMHIVLWSQSRNEMRLSTLDAETKRGRALYRENQGGSDWVIVCHGSETECRDAIGFAQPALAHRKKIRSECFNFEE